MATIMSQADDEADSDDVVIYIMPQRIQKKMLQDIQNGVNRTALIVCEKYGYGSVFLSLWAWEA